MGEKSSSGGKEIRMHYQMEHIVVERSEWTRPPHTVAQCMWPVEILDSSVLLGVIRIVPCDLAAYLQVTTDITFRE